MKLDNQAVFVTGANRGIGKALVEALLTHPVKKVYAAARSLADLPNFNDARVSPVRLDITQRDQIASAVAQAGDVTLLFNNAGSLAFASVVVGAEDDLLRDMRVNYLGTIGMVQGFVPTIEKNGGGAIANVISIVGLASMAGIGGYSASKAALFSATQAMRAELKSKDIDVHAIFPGPIDTDMAKEFQLEKTSPKVTAENILAGIQAGREDIFPDPMSANLGALWEKDPKSLERQFASM